MAQYMRNNNRARPIDMVHERIGLNILRRDIDSRGRFYTLRNLLTAYQSTVNLCLSKSDTGRNRRAR